MRIPLTIPIESRDGTLEKDEKLQNLTADLTQPESVMKRPAMAIAGLFVPVGQGFGIFGFPEDTPEVYVFIDTPPTSPGGALNPGTGTSFIEPFSVVSVDEYSEDSQYVNITISPYNPFNTGDVISSPSGFPLQQSYVVYQV